MREVLGTNLHTGSSIFAHSPAGRRGYKIPVQSMLQKVGFAEYSFKKITFPKLQFTDDNFCLVTVIEKIVTVTIK